MKTFVNDIYAERVIKGNPSNFTGVEVAGVRHTGERGDDDEKIVVVDNDSPEFFTCYLRHRDGRALSCADLGTVDEATDYGQKLAAKYGWTYRSDVKGHHHGA